MKANTSTPETEIKDPSTPAQKPVTEGPKSDRKPAAEFSKDMAHDRTHQTSGDGSSAAASTGKHSNGNRIGGDTSNEGSAESGGPDLDKAQDRQPPDADL